MVVDLWGSTEILVNIKDFAQNCKRVQTTKN
jgi:hypothetical protein